MEFIIALLLIGTTVAVIEAYRAHRNHVAFKAEVSADVKALESASQVAHSRISYLENALFRATAVPPPSVPPTA